MYAASIFQPLLMKYCKQPYLNFHCDYLVKIVALVINHTLFMLVLFLLIDKKQPVAFPADCILKLGTPI